MTYTATRDELTEALDNARRTRAALIEAGDTATAGRVQAAIDLMLDEWGDATCLDSSRDADRANSSTSNRPASKPSSV